MSHYVLVITVPGVGGKLQLGPDYLPNVLTSFITGKKWLISRISNNLNISCILQLSILKSILTDFVFTRDGLVHKYISPMS